MAIFLVLALLPLALGVLAVQIARQGRIDAQGQPQPMSSGSILLAIFGVVLIVIGLGFGACFGILATTGLGNMH